MPEYLRALVVVIVVSAFVFLMLSGPAKKIIGTADLRRWTFLWFAVTVVAFLAANFWVYAFAASLFVAYMIRRDPLRPAVYLLLLTAVPLVLYPIPGFGIINYFFYLTHDRLLALLILLPAFIAQVTKAGRTKTSSLSADRFLLLYYILLVVLVFRGTTITDTLRHALMLFLGMMLPYFVFSRSLRSYKDIQRCMLAFLLPAFIFAALGIFETAWEWRLYSGVSAVLGESAEGIFYLRRVGSLRAATTASSPIVFGYTMMVGLGILFAFAQHYLSKPQRILAFSVIILGLIASLSRGPWVGAVALVLVFLATGRGRGKTVAQIGFLVTLALVLVSQTSLWDKVVGLIPFVGNIEAENVDYRVRLFDNAWTVIQRNPWFGSIDFKATEEMQSLIQGQGIIDIVNTYIGVALSYGLVGLSLFAGFFILVIGRLRRAYRSLPAEEEELRLTGRALFATLVAVLVTIGTVSSIGTIPMIYWSLAGIAVAYTRVVQRLLSGRAGVISQERISQPQNHG